MFVKRYVSEGLAHYSYLIADKGQATLIDPRRDIDVYLQDTAEGGFHIDHVLETHRNEDYLIGSCELEAATGAEIFHADSQWDYQYGMPVAEGQQWFTGRLMIEAIHTPGHTPGSMSYLLHDPDGNPWMIFTGDALFSGDVGRVDLLGQDRLAEMGGHLYDSIFKKILPLGDPIIVCPAHGAGSVCGGSIGERTWTTIGLERQHNSKLQVDSKQEFIDLHAEMLDRPAYFRKMEELNLEGPPILGRVPTLRPLQPDAFEGALEVTQVVDTRDQISFAAGYIRDSLSIVDPNLAVLAGWFLDYTSPVLFVCDPAKVESTVRRMIRMGFDDLSGYLQSGVVGWTLGGKPLESIGALTVDQFCEVVKADTPKLLLDVRGEDELSGEGLKYATRIQLVRLREHLAEIPKDKPIFTLCGRGNRSMTAASILKRQGWEEVGVLLGGLSAWDAYDCGYEL